VGVGIINHPANSLPPLNQCFVGMGISSYVTSTAGISNTRSVKRVCTARVTLFNIQNCTFLTNIFSLGDKFLNMYKFRQIRCNMCYFLPNSGSAKKIML